MTDIELIKQCLSKKESAYKLLYERYSGWLYAVALRYCSDSDDAQDVLQDSFIAIFDNLKQYNQEKSFAGWMKKITVNTALAVHRKKNAAVYKNPVREIEDQQMIDITLLQELEVQEINLLIEQLTPGRRQVFNLYFIEGYTHKEIAEMLQISEGTSKSQLFDAKKELKAAMEKLEAIIETKKI
ncbi:MAG: RNA polymerase sigma factor [Crocinitomicaceae bacterium]